MKLAYKTLAIAAAFAMAGAAHAATSSVTVEVGGTASALGVGLSNLKGTGTLAFSVDLLGALDAGAIVVTAAAPGTVAVVEATEDVGQKISATAPLASLTASVDDVAHNFTVTNVSTVGGATMTAPKKNFATTKGSLSITGITVDLGTKAITADIDGGNGVGVLNDVHVWDFTNLGGPVSFPSVGGPATATNTLTGLVITGEAFDIFAKSLGLTSGGIAAMREIKDYGVMTANVSLDVTAVPEPSAYMMVLAGLAAVGFAAKRARRA
jgi:hypothetical protein